MMHEEFHALGMSILAEGLDVEIRRTFALFAECLPLGLAVE